MERSRLAGCDGRPRSSDTIMIDEALGVGGTSGRILARSGRSVTYAPFGLTGSLHAGCRLADLFCITEVGL